MFRVNKSYSAIEAGPAKAAELDGELLECCAEAAALEAHARALTKGIPSSGRSLEWDAADAMMEEAYDLRERAIALPARTPAGLQAKAKVVAARINDEDPIVMGMVFSIARDVLGRAGA